MSQKTYRFIIADDDHELRFFVRRILLQHYPDASVAEAANGEEALELYDADGADLMVVDYKIPHINGAELIRKLRERSATIPIVMASNYPDAKNEAMTAGATCFLEKEKLSPQLGYFLPALVPSRK